MIPNQSFTIIGIQETENLVDPMMHNKMLLSVPNPFSTTIDLYFNTGALSSSEHPTLRIFDVTGRLVRNFDLSTIKHIQNPKISWDGTDDRGLKVARGIYFCELVTDEDTVMEKIIYIR